MQKWAWRPWFTIITISLHHGHDYSANQFDFDSNEINFDYYTKYGKHKTKVVTNWLTMEYFKLLFRVVEQTLNHFVFNENTLQRNDDKNKILKLLDFFFYIEAVDFLHVL